MDVGKEDFLVLKIKQAMEAIREWRWGRASLRDIQKHARIANSMKHRYIRQPASHQACESVYHAATSVFSEYCCMATSSAFERSANANVAIRAGAASKRHAEEAIRKEEESLQREVTRGFVSAIIHDESALILLDKCRDGDTETRAIWMDRIAELGLTI